MEKTGIYGVTKTNSCDPSPSHPLTECAILQFLIGGGDLPLGSTPTESNALYPSTVSSQWVELRWSVMGDRISSDHNYRLYSALIEQIPNLKELDWQLGTITGVPDNKGWIKLGRKSTLSIRCMVNLIPVFGILDNQILRIGQSLIQLGEMQGSTLSCVPNLSTRIATIRIQNDFRVDPFEFGVAIGKQLANKGIKCIPILGDRCTLKIKDCVVVGYGLRFEKLEPLESMILQTQGLGGRRRMGCGVFYA